MYAVIRTGGKQYRVAPGDILEVEKLDGNVGDSITLDDVLMVVDDGDVQIGQPTIADAVVTAKITGQHRGEKIMVFRYRPKKRIRVRRGHRQYLTRLQIETINGETGVVEEVEHAAPVAAEAAQEETSADASASTATASPATAEAPVEEEAPVEANASAVEGAEEQSEDGQELDSSEENGADENGAEEQEGEKE